MKKLAFSTLVFMAGLLIILVGCTKTDTEAEKANAEAALRAFYDAVETFDKEGIRSLSAEGFHIIENGTSYNLEEFMKMGDSFIGYTGDINMEFVETEVVRDMAFMVVKFDAVWIKEPAKMFLNTIENYILKKVEGKWLVYFWQSTYLPDKGDRKFTSVHLLKVPDDASFTKVDSLFKVANSLIANAGYPDCGYTFYKVVEGEGLKYNWVLNGNWKTEENYAVIHQNEDLNKFYEGNIEFFKSLFKDEVYVKVALP